MCQELKAARVVLDMLSPLSFPATAYISLVEAVPKPQAVPFPKGKPWGVQLPC